MNKQQGMPWNTTNDKFSFSLLGEIIIDAVPILIIKPVWQPLELFWKWLCTLLFDKISFYNIGIQVQYDFKYEKFLGDHHANSKHPTHNCLA